MTWEGGRPVRVLSLSVAFALASLGAARADHCPVAPELGGPLISATTAYVGGTHVWTDYVYDDRGTNSNAIPGGDAAYPAAPHPGNTADLIQLDVGTGAGGALAVTALLETLVPGYDAAVGVGFDTDQNSATGAATIPGGLWTMFPGSALGLEQMVVLDSRTGTATLMASVLGVWQTVATTPATVDRDCNTISATVPGLVPGAATWKVVGVVGLSDASGSWVNGGINSATPIHDLAYIKDVDPVTDPHLALYQQVPQVYQPWQDDMQSNILAGLADPAPAIATIQFGTGQTQLNAAVDVHTPGIYTFLYHSALDLGEGAQGGVYKGPYQPYVVYISSTVPDDGPPPAVVFMHGANQNHLVNAVHFNLEGATVPGLASYDVPAVIVLGLGRDPNWNTGPAEMDLLETTNDAIARLGLDAERIVLSGISAGGIGTFRHLARYPDKWTGGYSIVGGGTTTLANMINVPLRFHNGAADPLVNVQTYLDSEAAADAAGVVDYRGALVTTSSHLPEGAGNCWYLDLISRPRAVNPPHVIYTARPSSYFIDAAVGLDLHPDSAYWVSNIVSNDSSDATVDATSLRADRGRVAADIDELEQQNVSQGYDFCGPNPDVMTGDEWQLHGRSFAPAPVPLECFDTRLVATLTNTASVTLDVARAGLVPAGQTASDWDADGVPDAGDNCPYAANPGQEDGGGINTSTPNGVGDACECGDVSGNGRINGQDANAIRRQGLGSTPNPLFVTACNCDVSGNGACNGQDATAVSRAALGLSPNPLFANGCESRTGARRVAVTSDGASDVTLSGLLPGTGVSLDGAPLGAVGAAGSFTVPVPSGAHTVLLLP
jgi:hypothetical protein